jgi:hypothetical protein
MAGGGYRPRDRFEIHIMHACICISICKCILLYMRCPLTFISALLLFERALVLTIVCLCLWEMMSEIYLFDSLNSMTSCFRSYFDMSEG